jgi:hypothetical protein
MNKLLINLTACAFGLVLSSTVFAADQMAPKKDSSPEAAQSDTQGAPSDNAGGMTADKAAKPDDVSEAYTTALKKCAALSGAQKDTCEKNAKKNPGKM